jgi:hypothetical protein
MYERGRVAGTTTLQFQATDYTSHSFNPHPRAGATKSQVPVGGATLVLSGDLLRWVVNANAKLYIDNFFAKE